MAMSLDPSIRAERAPSPEVDAITVEPDEPTPLNL